MYLVGGSFLLKVAICDDDLLFANRIADIVKSSLSFIELKVDIFIESKELLNANSSFDIALLDINMKSINGIELAKFINHNNPKCKIIFVTSYLNYATEVYDSEHIYFVLKTNLDHHLPLALDKAITLLENEKTRFITILQKGKIINLLQNNIIYLERCGRTTYINCQEEVFTTSESFSILEEQLFFPPFARCHNSFIVNFNYVKKFERTEILLNNNIIIPISRSYTDNTKKTFFKYIGEML